MKQRLKTFFHLGGLSLMMALVFAGCKKEDTLVIPDEYAHFLNQGGDSYFVTAPNTTYSLSIGTTNVSDADRTISFSVSSPTGAVEGTHYTLSTHSITIPAGQSKATVTVSGDYNEYTSGRKDTLIFTINDPSVEAAPYNREFKLFMRGPCFDGEVDDITIMGGAFANTFEGGGSYGPYTVTVSSLTQTGPTTATAQISNLWDYFGPVTINFDWTDPNNTIVSIPLQQTDQDYDVGQPFLIRTSPGQVSKFSVCNNKITLTVDIIVNNFPAPGSAAYYDQNLDIVLSR